MTNTAPDPWLRPRWRDMIAIVAVALFIMAAAVSNSSDDSKVVLIGPLYDSQAVILCNILGIFAAGGWIISRCWVNRKDLSSWGRAVSGTVIVTAFAGCVLAGFFALWVWAWSTSDTYTTFDVPGQTDTYAVRCSSGPGDPQLSIYRGGPWTYALFKEPSSSSEVPSGICTSDVELTVDREDDELVLMYPTDDEPVRITLPTD